VTDAVARLTAALAGRYRIAREIGAGGMATVYLAEDVKHRRQVAVKVLNPGLAAALGAERFLREIEIAAGLHHPHILPLYDSGEAGGFLYYVMPLAEGESLRERLDREKQLPIEDALRIASEVADALSYAHSHDVIHRDIKPGNILLESGHAVVADFGIARAITAAGGQTLTATGMAIGTPAYMSPEQAAGEKALDGRSDLYALGCVLYEMLAGQPPFTGPTVESVIHQHLAVEVPSISGIRPAVPAAVAAALQRALAKTPADRFNPVALFAEALSRPVPAPVLAAAPAPTPPQPRRLGRSARLGVAAAVLGGGALLAWAGWHALRPGQRPITFINDRFVTREPALEIQEAISPDGREVAYASGYPGATHIEVRDVGGGRPRSLTGDWGGAQVGPRWTPDGASIRFINAQGTADHGAGVWTIPRMGGQALAADSGATVAVAPRWELEWRGDSAFARRADGSATLLFTGRDAVHSAAWSPDGTRLAFVRGNRRYAYINNLGNVGPSAIWVVTPGSAPVPVTHDSSLNVSPAWLPDGRLLFVSDRDGPRDIYAIRLDGSGRPRGSPQRLTTGLDAYSVSVSADGATVAYDKFQFRRNIYSLPIPRTGTISIHEARPVTTGNQTVENLGISRDGRWLTYDSNLDGNQDIYVIPAAGGEPRRVTRHPGSDFSPDFSPDGREIVFYSTRNGTRDIYLINADGTGEQRLVGDSAESYHPAFSPDGLRIAYYDDDLHHHGVYLLHRDSIHGAWSAPELLVAEGRYPRWSADGGRLVLVGGRRLWTVTLGGAERTLIDGRAGGLVAFSYAEWSPDGGTIFFENRGPDLRDLYAIPSAGGHPRLVVRFDDPAMTVYDIPVTVGNGRFYFAIAEMESDIHVMDLVQH